MQGDAILDTPEDKIRNSRTTAWTFFIPPLL